MMKIAIVSLAAAVVSLIIAINSSSQVPLDVGRALMMLAVFSSLVSFTMKLVEDTEIHSLRYRR